MLKTPSASTPSARPLFVFPKLQSLFRRLLRQAVFHESLPCLLPRECPFLLAFARESQPDRPPPLLSRMRLGVPRCCAHQPTTLSTRNHSTFSRARPYHGPTLWADSARER